MLYFNSLKSLTGDIGDSTEPLSAILQAVLSDGERLSTCHINVDLNKHLSIED